MINHELDPRAARDFLSKPFDHIDTAVLSGAPDLQQLSWAAGLPYEVAFYEFGSKWYTLRGTEGGIPMVAIPVRSTNFIHSHPTFLTEDASIVAIPSLLDFHNIRVGINAFITSSVGITQYFPPEDHNVRREVEREIEAFRPRFNHPSSLSEYLKFMDENKLRYEVHLWESMTEEKLQALLHTSIA